MKKSTLSFLSLSLMFCTSSAFARGYYNASAIREDNFMVSNGQGVSSPGFWQGLNAQNPAGLINNQRLKIQGSAASFDDSTKNLRGAGGILIGNGTLAAGAEYSTFNAGPIPTGASQINWGIAARLAALNTTLAISGHHSNPNGGASYDLGTLIDLLPSVRLGGYLPNFTNGLHVVAAGLTFLVDPMVDFVVDAAYQIDAKNGTLKPGISLHTDLIQATASYGFRFTGDQDVYLYSKFSGALGLRLTDNVLVEYEYRGLPEHRLGLTLRM